MLTTVGLITALLYLFGRAYGSALITTLKLPEVLLPISLNQYYEWGAIPLFFFAVALATAFAYGLNIRFFWSNACFFVVAMAIDAVLTLLTWPLRAFWHRLLKLPLPSWLRLPSFQMPQSIQQWLRSRLSRYQRWFPITDAESRRLQQLSQYSTAVMTLILGMFVLGGVFAWMLYQSAVLGHTSATQITIHPARIFLTKPISARPATTTTLSDGTTGYVYDKLFLIAHTEDHYFVFEALDSASCTPQEILQVPADHVIDVVYGAPQHLDQLCQSMFPPVAPTPVPGPTATAVPTP